MNINEFYADNLGKELSQVVTNALTAKIARRFL